MTAYITIELTKDYIKITRPCKPYNLKAEISFVKYIKHITNIPTFTIILN